MNHADKISKACKSLIFTEPFYGLFLVGLNKHYSKEIPTAGVSVHGIGVKLTINPDFVDGLSMDHTMGLLKHELLHIAFGHLQLRDKYKDKKLFNIAADLEINQYIDAQYLPEGGLTLESFPELNLPYRAGTETYYKLLSDAQNVSGDGESCPSLNNILNEMDADENHQTNHPTWDEFESLSDTEQKMIEKQVEHQIKESA
ncbi:MAG: hypothetical protein HRT87_06730, partial [Legionellales bacterium]|nr:hypothetical protein [Legionellales bacterium]